MTLEAYFEKPSAEELKWMEKRRKSQPTKQECFKHDRQKHIKQDMTSNRPVGNKKC